MLDTNALVSALLTDGISRKVYFMALEKCTLLRSEQTFMELIHTLEKPKLQRYFKSEKIKTDFVSHFLEISTFITVHSRFDLCRDRKNNMLLELAVDGQALFIISGDKDLQILNPFRGISILSPSDFLAWADGKIL